MKCKHREIDVWQSKRFVTKNNWGVSEIASLLRIKMTEKLLIELEAKSKKIY